MKRCRTKNLCSDCRGQVTVEWALVVAAVAIPMLLVFRFCLMLLVSKYQMMTFMSALPLP